MAWYGENRRALPWRETRDPYAILVSEVMLQQTQVARVVPRYLAWLERWPTVEALAAATPAEVITAWSGMGYNRRAVNLHRCAVAVAALGGFPREPEELRRLPGIGPYTAAAIACFAFGAQIAAPDTNARRVLERAFGNPDLAPPPGRAYEWNQALFDLGREVCIARTPALRRLPAGGGVPVAGHDVRATSAPVAVRGLVPAAPGAAPAGDRRGRVAAGRRGRRRGARVARARRPGRGADGHARAARDESGGLARFIQPGGGRPGRSGRRSEGSSASGRVALGQRDARAG